MHVFFSSEQHVPGIIGAILLGSCICLGISHANTLKRLCS